MVLWLEKRPLLKFVLGVIALLPASFVVWYFLGGYLAVPAVMVAKPVLLAWLGGSIDSVVLQGTDMLVATGYGDAGGRVVAAEVAGNRLAYPVNTRVLSYSLPFYAALHFATPMASSWTRLGWNLLWLWLLLALGLISTTLKDLVFAVGPVFRAAETVPPTEIVALLYQLSTLMVPALGPVVLWAYAAKDSPTFISLLPQALRPAQDRDASS
jgi:hypothetical protein